MLLKHMIRRNLSRWLCLVMVVASLLCTISFGCGTAASSTDATRSAVLVEEQEVVHIRTDGDCDDATWQRASTVSSRQSSEDVTWAFEILSEKLRVWDSHCKDIVKMILEAIAEHKIEAGRGYLVRFLNVDLEMARAEPIARAAARSLGQLGGEGALEALVDAASSRSPGLRASVAVALGTLADSRGLATLETLAFDSSPDVRRRALSALATFCSSSSRDIALSALEDNESFVRNSATWWVATCGGASDAWRLEARLDDTNDLVRANALRGLIRLRSGAGCRKSSQLLVDESPTVQELARDYKAACKGP